MTAEFFSCGIKYDIKSGKFEISRACGNSCSEKVAGNPVPVFPFLVAMKFGEFATYGTDTRFQFVGLSRGKQLSR